jgi:hypothetical protein
VVSEPMTRDIKELFWDFIVLAGAGAIGLALISL